MADTTQTAVKPTPKKAPGASFTPDLNTNRAAVETTRWFWLGALPDCPSESVDLAGCTFSKLNELLVNNDGSTSRVPMIGCLAQLTKSQVEAMRERMSRTVIRFQSPKQPRPTTPLGVDAVLGIRTDRRKGQLITIPTAEDIENRRKNNYPIVHYEQQPLDEPAADYLFAQVCPDQSNPARGTVYPPPLSQTGLEWPATN